MQDTRYLFPDESADAIADILCAMIDTTVYLARVQRVSWRKDGLIRPCVKVDSQTSVSPIGDEEECAVAVTNPLWN